MTIVARPSLFAATPTFARAALVLPFCATIQMSGWLRCHVASPVSPASGNQIHLFGCG